MRRRVDCGAMDLFPDFRDLLAAFAASGVRYVLLGGYAVGRRSWSIGTRHGDGRRR